MKKFLAGIGLVTLCFSFFACSVMVNDFTDLVKAVDYQVEYYADGITNDEIDYNHTIAESILVKHGKPEKYKAPAIPGFTYSSQKVIKVSKEFYKVQVTYKRINTSIVYRIDTDDKIAHWTGIDPEENETAAYEDLVFTGKYGSSTAAFLPPQDISEWLTFKEFYLFDGWDVEIPSTFQAQDVVINMDYKFDNTNLNEGEAFYVVRRYFEDASITDPEECWILEESFTHKGTVGSTIVVAPAEKKAEEGYLAPVVSETVIVADGSAICTVKYERKTVNFSIKYYKEDASTVPSTWELIKTETGSGKIGATTTFTLDEEDISKDGYLDAVFDNVVIAADGSSTIEVKYERASVTYTFDPNGGKWENSSTDPINITGKIGASYVFNNVPSRTDYCFTGYDPDNTGIFGVEDKTFVATWIESANQSSGLNGIVDSEVVVKAVTSGKVVVVTCMVPYDGNWTFYWQFDGVDFSENTASITKTDCTYGTHNISVYAVDSKYNQSFTKSIVVEVVK